MFKTNGYSTHPPPLVWLIFLAILISACGQPATPALTPVTVQLAWTHQAQFAGMYAADQKGYYAAEGLAVKFVEGSTTIDSVEVVRSGAAQFGIASADAFLIDRAAGKPVSAIAVILRRSPRVYVALTSSGIIRPQDFAGKTISVNATGHVPFEALMKRVGIQPDQYTLVDSSADLSTFYSGQVQVRSVYLTNEVVTMRAAGYKVNIIYPDDYGVHNYGDTLITSDSLVAAQPDRVLRFVRATLKGWTYAVEHPSEIGAMVLKYNPKANPALENAKMAASLPLVNTGEDFIGWMKPEIWSGMAQILQQYGALSAPLDVSKAYTMQFLDALYK
jgi:NitT/TauT family transport system substrate-binding protein